MTERFKDKDPAEEIFHTLKALQQTTTEVKPGLLMQALVSRYYDFDTTDLRDGISRLFTYQIIALSFSGHVHLVGTLEQLNDPRFCVRD